MAKQKGSQQKGSAKKEFEVSDELKELAEKIIKSI